MKNKDFEKITCDNDKCKMPVWILALSFMGSNEECEITQKTYKKVSITVNNAADINAFKEKYSNTKTKNKMFRYNLEKHHIKEHSTNMSDLEFVKQIIKLYDNFVSHDLKKRPKYNLIKRNCATWVYSLLRVAGISKEDSEQYGEFKGIDWGEERFDRNGFKELFEKNHYDNVELLQEQGDLK